MTIDYKRFYEDAIQTINKLNRQLTEMVRLHGQKEEQHFQLKTRLNTSITEIQVQKNEGQNAIKILQENDVVLRNLYLRAETVAGKKLEPLPPVPDIRPKIGTGVTTAPILDPKT